MKIMPALLASALFATSPSFVANAQTVPAAEAKAIAADAYLYAYPMLYNYKTLFQQTADPSFPGYIGGFNRYRHYSRGFTPADKDIVTPSNDTPYSWAWLDLRAEPMVVSVPASPNRYYVLQWFDLYTHNFAYIGSRATGTEAGDYLFAGPAGMAIRPRASSRCSARKRSSSARSRARRWSGAEDRDGLVAMQRQYRIRPLSEYTGAKPPAPAPTYQFPAWDEARANSIGFIDYLNFILQFTPPVASEKAALERFAKIGIGPGRASMRQHSIRQPRMRSRPASRTDSDKLQATLDKTTSSVDLFGTREFLGTDYVMRRAVGAAMGIYGNSKEEAYYTAYTVDADKQALDGSKNYVLHFSKDQVPPVKFFWSMTMYDLPGRLLVDKSDQSLRDRQSHAGAQDERRRLCRHLSAGQVAGRGQGVQLAADAAEGPVLHGAAHVWPARSARGGSWQAPQPAAAK